MNYDFNYHGPVVVFDLDDTLFRERDFCRSGFRVIEKLIVEERGPAFIGVSKRMDTILRRRENYFSWLENVTGGEVGRYVEAYRNHKPYHLNLADGVEELLEKLRKQGIRVGIITDGRSTTQRNKIRALHLDRYVDDEDIFISEETGSDKTSPDNFCAVVRRYPEASRFIYIGDNEAKDFLMPNRMGWSTFRVPAHHDNVHRRLEYQNSEGAAQDDLTSVRDIESKIFK